jgi:hypothetical protein
VGIGTRPSRSEVDDEMDDLYNWYRHQRSQKYKDSFTR